MIAAAEGQLEFVKLLIQNQAHVDIWNDECVTTLWLAAENGQMSVVQRLLSEGLDARNGCTPAMAAAQNGQLETVELLKNKANVRDFISATGLVILLKIGIKSSICLARVTLKFDGWPKITKGHLFYTAWSFAHHFKAISEFKLELQSGNAQFGSKSTIFFTLQFDVWHWKTIGHLFNANSSFVHHSITIGEFKLELQSGNAQSGSNSTIFLALGPWNLTDDLEKQ